MVGIQLKYMRLAISLTMGIQLDDFYSFFYRRQAQFAEFITSHFNFPSRQAYQARYSLMTLGPILERALRIAERISDSSMEATGRPGERFSSLSLYSKLKKLSSSKPEALRKFLDGFLAKLVKNFYSPIPGFQRKKILEEHSKTIAETKKIIGFYTRVDAAHQSHLFKSVGMLIDGLTRNARSCRIPSDQSKSVQTVFQPSIHFICFASRAMSSKPFQVKSDISGRFSSQDSSRLESPVTDPDNWEPAVLIPAKGPESETNISQNQLNTAIGKYKKTSPPLQTAMSTSVRTAKANTVYATPKVNTTTRSQKTSKSLMASTQKTTDSARVTPLSTSSTQKSMNPLLDSEFGLKLNKESMELIKTDYITRYSPNGRDLPEDKQAALTTLECYSSHLETRLRECGQYLDEMVGDRCVMIREARKALEQIVSMGIITTEELVASPDCERFSLASDNDVITIHSLSNIVRKIINGRRVVA